MSTHTYHEPTRALLHDGCPRCREHTERPWFTLDANRRDLLVIRALSWESEDYTPLSRTEQDALLATLDLLNACRALFTLSSSEVVAGALWRQKEREGK